MSKPPLTSSVLLIVGCVAAGLVAAWLLFGLTRGRSAQSVVLLAIALGPSVYGARAWRARGRGWAAIASWTLPLALAMGTLAFAQAVPGLVAAIGGAAGIVVGFLMAESDELAAAWYRRVLHREIVGRGPR